VGITLLAVYDEPAALLYLLPINWLLWYLPAWGIASLIRTARRK
jgi:hypothetical protein